jgi:riboflavin synthase
MFTGIIESVGTVSSVTQQGGGIRLRVDAPFSGELQVDESVAVSGVCQTVTEQDARSFVVTAVEETLAKTNLGALREGSSVNLERARRLGDRLDGHMVQGHVDATAVVVDRQELESSHLFSLRFEEQYAKYLIPVGSVCLDGISLTVARLEGEILTVAIIPHTLANTTVSEWRRDSRVNIEFDMVGKYVVGFLDRA